MEYREFKKDYILNNSLPKNKFIFSGIYFLIDNKQIVYVGKSENVSYRINVHKKENIKKFNDVFFYKSSKR